MFSRSIYAIHDQALTFEFSTNISEEVHLLIIQIHRSFQENPFDGFIESVPAYTSLTVYFNQHIQAKKVEDIFRERYSKCIQSSLTTTNPSKYPINHIIPVCYDKSMGLDLEDVAKQCNLTIEEIIKIHTSQVFRVYMLGFVPGFPYMGILPCSLETKRKSNPRLKVPAGSVAIAGLQTGIYPSSIPGGWNIIGRTPITMFDKYKDACSFLSPGDLIQFESISQKEFESYA